MDLLCDAYSLQLVVVLFSYAKPVDARHMCTWVNRLEMRALMQTVRLLRNLKVKVAFDKLL